MRIGIDISQTAYPGSGVAKSVTKLVNSMISQDKTNEYVLFFSSLRKDLGFKMKDLRKYPNVSIKQFRFPPSLLSFVWNRLHIMPIESLIGDVDVFISSDWTESPVRRAKKVTFIHDLVVYKYPEETHNATEFSLKKFNISQNLVSSQKMKLAWAVKECSAFICPSESTKKDIHEILGVENKKIHVVGWGV